MVIAVSYSNYLASLALFASLLIGYGVSKATYNLFFHPLRRFPGPKLSAATALPSAFRLLRGKPHEDILELHKQYGDIVRTGPNELSFTHPDAWKEVCGHLRNNGAENGKDPKYADESRDFSLISASRERHGPMRRTMAHGFSAQAIADQQPLINAYIDKFIQALRECGESGAKALNLTHWYEWTTFDIIGDLSFGQPFGCLKERRSHLWVDLLFSSLAVFPIFQAISDLPFSSVLKPIYVILAMPKDFLRTRKIIDDFGRETVQERLKLGAERPDFIQAMRRERADYKMTEREMIDNALVLVGAGSETTATTLAAATYFICSHPKVLARLNKEVRSAFTSEDEINVNSVGKLDYTIALLKEAMRVYPPVPIALIRKTPVGGSTIAGEHIVGGTTLGLWQYAMYHLPSNFKDADSFIPERWLGDERFDGDKKDIHQPFSFGPRNCIGQNLAYLEMRLILARIVWNFDLEMSPESKDWTKNQEVFFFWKKPALMVNLKPRKI